MNASARFRQGGTRGLLIAFAALLALSAGGCAFDNELAELRRLHASGQYAVAAQRLDDPKTIELYGDKNRLLWTLERGAVGLALGQDDVTIATLEEAERIMDIEREHSAGDTLAQWTINDGTATYVGEPYEDIYVNDFKLMAQLREGRIAGGATVEARRAAGKADWLRSRYGRFAKAVDEKAGSSGLPGAGSVGNAGPATAVVGDAAKAGEFIESPLATYLTAVTFMKTGETNMQAVAGRRLLDSIAQEQGLIGPVNAANFLGLSDRRADSANLLVVAFSGRGPVMEARTIGPIPVFDWPVYFQLPVLVPQPSEVVSARVVVEAVSGAEAAGATNVPRALDTPPGSANGAANGPGGAGGTVYAPGSPIVSVGPAVMTQDLALVEDLSAVAVENHRRELPLIYERALIRSSIKAGASFALSEVARHSHGQAREGLFIASVIGGIAAEAITERADLRCWVFLPGQARVTMMKVPAGTYRVRVEYVSGFGGVVYSSMGQVVKVEDGAGALATVVEHFWR